MKKSFFCTAFLLLCTLVYAKTPTLKLKFNEEQDIKIADQDIHVGGAFTEDGYWVYGKKGLSLPAGQLLDESAGTIKFSFRITQPVEELLIPRYILSLRTHSRLTVNFTLSAGQEPKLNFSFSDRNKTVRYTCKENLNYNQDYSVAFSYDGKKLNFYLDGKLLLDAPQPLPVKNIRNLNLGPYRDAWLAPKSWGNDCQAKELMVWNRALSTSEIAELSGIYFTPLHESMPPLLTVPRLTGKAPLIDGELSDEAWKYAAGMPWLIYGLSKEKSGELPPHRFALTYDEENIYLGFLSIFPGGTPIQAGGLREKDREGEVWGSESFEFYLFVNDSSYRFGGNVAGGYVEWKGVRSEWDGDWTYKTTLQMRIDDSQVWQGEAVIPWKTLELEGPPKEELKFNFCRTWKIPEIETVSSLNLTGGTYGKAEEMVKIRFVEECPVLQVLDQNNPSLGEYRYELALASGAGGNIRYELQLGRLDGSAEPLELLDKSFNLKAKEYLTEKMTQSISNPAYNCLIYTLSRNSNIYMREIVPFKLIEEYFTAKTLFLSEQIVVNIRVPMLKNLLGENFSGSIILSDEKQKNIFQQKVDSEEIRIPFNRNSPAGQYKLTLTNELSNELIYERDIFYPGVGEWEKQDFSPERIIPPFTKLEYRQTGKNFQASPWGREYSWQEGLFPAQIKSQGTSCLSEPVKLLVNDQELHLADFNIVKNADHRAEISARVQSNLCDVSGDSWLEYDGVLWNKVEIKAKQPLKNLQLLIKMPSSLAKYFHASVGGSWGNKITTELFPGQRSVRYYPVLWFGMEDKGLCFFMETRKGLKSPIQSTYLINKDPENTSLLLNLAPSLEATEELSFEFGLLASPVRPFSENYPLNTLGWSYMVPLHHPGKRPTCDVSYIMLYGTNSGDLGSFFADQDTDDSRRRSIAIEKSLKDNQKFGGRAIPYTCALYLSEKYPEVSAFKDEWNMVPEISMDYDHSGHIVYGCCPSTSANDFFVYRYKKMLERFDLKGIYFDFGATKECSNKLHGCEQRHPILGLREFYRRIALVQLEAGIKAPLTVVHNTDHIQLPALTFTTHLLNGEQVRQASSSLLHNKKDILDTYKLDMFASELSSLPFGITNSVYIPADNLAARYGGDEADEPYKFRQTKAIMAATLPHNTLPCMWRLHYGVFDKLLRYYDNFQVPEAEFYGYWQKPANLIKGQDVLISVYKHKNENKILAIIGHIGKEHLDQQILVSFDLTKLKLKKLSKALDLMTADDPDYAALEERMKKYKVPRVRAPLKLGEFGTKIISMENNILTLQLPYHSFALVELSE